MRTNQRNQDGVHAALTIMRVRKPSRLCFIDNFRRSGKWIIQNSLVPGGGLEPPLDCSTRILSPIRLPKA